MKRISRIWFLILYSLDSLASFLNKESKDKHLLKLIFQIGKPGFDAIFILTGKTVPTEQLVTVLHSLTTRSIF